MALGVRGDDVSRSKNMAIARDKGCFLHRFNLKFAGKIKQRDGLSNLLDFLDGLNATAMDSLSRIRSDRAFQKIRIPDELARPHTNPDPAQPDDRKNFLKEKNISRRLRT